MKSLFSLALSGLLPLAMLISGCQTPTGDSMTEQEARTLLERYVGTLSHPDSTTIQSVIAPGYELYSPLFPEPIRGVDGYTAMAVQTVTSFPDFQVSIGAFAVVGNEIWGRFTMSGTNTGPLGTLPPTGKKFQISAVAISTVANGKIIRDETFWNVLDMYQQLGFTLVPQSADTGEDRP